MQVTPLTFRPAQSNEWVDRLFAKVDLEIASGCWLWRGTLDRDGYGLTGLAGPLGRRVHRVVWQLMRGEIPDGMVIDHICFVRNCVNPEHLRVVTVSFNARRQRMHLRTVRTRTTRGECANGHPATIENTYVSPQGQHECRPCRNDRSNEYKARKRGRPSLGHSSTRTHCPEGHPYSGENTYISPKGDRDCRICRRDRRRKFRERRKQIA